MTAAYCSRRRGWRYAAASSEALKGLREQQAKLRCARRPAVMVAMACHVQSAIKPASAGALRPRKVARCAAAHLEFEVLVVYVRSMAVHNQKNCFAGRRRRCRPIVRCEPLAPLIDVVTQQAIWTEILLRRLVQECGREVLWIHCALPRRCAGRSRSVSQGTGGGRATCRIDI